MKFFSSLLFSLIASATWVQAAPHPDPVALAGLEVRVGSYSTALKLLETYAPGDQADGAAARFVRARALFGLGRHKESLSALSEVKSPLLAQASAWLSFQIAVVLGDEQRTLSSAREVAELGSLPSRLQARLEIEVSRIQLVVPATAARARSTLTRLLSHRDRSVRAHAMAILADEGDLKLMARLLVEYPDTEQARRRTHWMKRVQLDLTQRTARADELFRFRAYDLAAPAYEALTQSGDPAIEQKAHVRRATIQMRMREGYEKSRGHLESALKGPDLGLRLDALYRLGLVFGHLGQYDTGREMMETFVKEGGRGRRRVNANYQMGRLMHEAGRYTDSLVAHRRFLKTKPPDRQMWQWFEGWTLFRSGQYPEARKALKKLTRSKNLLVGAKALYWTARCYRLEGKHDLAEATLIKLERRAPLSYYGFLGAALRGQVPPRRIPRTHVSSLTELGSWTQKLSKGAARKLSTVRTLVRVGELVLARHRARESKLKVSVSRSLPRRLRKKALDQVDILLERWGDRWKVQSKERRRVPWREALAGRSDAERFGAYPPSYYSLARAAGRPHDVSPWWLIAHMLQESRYKERAKSHAVALGTMQILPRTGRRIADRLGFPNGDFSPDQLFNAGVGLRQAAWYLDALRREFSGNVVLAIAAYNGGPRRLAQHVRTVGEVPFDVLVEEIGAHETRNYVRKVTDHLVRHLDMYADDAERARVLKSILPPDRPVKARGELRF